MSVPKPRHTFPLVASFEGADVVVCVPPAVWRRRAAISILLVPLVVWLTVVLIGARLGLSAEDASPLIVIATTLTVAAVIVGGALLAFAKPLSKRSRIVIDRTARRVRRERDGVAVSFDEIALVRVRRNIGVSRWTVLDLVGTKQEPLLTLHPRLPARDDGDVDALATFLTGCLVSGSYRQGQAVAVVDTVAPRTYLLSERAATMLCYLPILGLNIYLNRILQMADDRPAVMFAVRQASMHSLSALYVFLGATFLVGIPSMALENTAFHTPLLGAFGVVIILDGVVWLGGTLIAFIQAGRGRIWVMPWLRRWLAAPPQQGG